MERLAIVGAGIGGLVTAIALARQNVPCVVFERHPALPDDGAGIQLSPNAAAALHDLGAGAAFDTAVRPVCREIRRWRDNALIGRTELGRVAESRYGAPYYTLRRCALVGALREAAGPATVRFGHHCVAVEQDGTGVVLRFRDASEARAGAVVGADGLHSAVRGLFTRDQPRYRGYVASRAVLPREATRSLLEPDRVVAWLGPDRHCVAYPIDRGRRVNLVVVAPAPRPPGRTVRVSGTDLLPGFGAWHHAVRELIGRAGQLEQRALHDGPSMPRWHRGRVVLIGDAAHPMLPLLAQGAAQAIEDAATLARCVRHPEAFARFEALRRERVGRVVEGSRAALSTYHLPDGDEQRRRDRAIGTAARESLDWLYGHRPAVAAP